MKATSIYFLNFILLLFLLISCKKENKPNNPYPFEGEWKLKSVGSNQYLKYYAPGANTGFDIYSGVQSNFEFIAGSIAGTYFIVATANIDKYMDVINLGYTYLTSNNFTNSNTQLFTVEPIYNDADRYYIRSVADTSKYLVSKYSNYGIATTTALYPLDLENWDCIWVLEK
jgi:hypothetical protein